jgi:hypothetical protein
MGGGDAHGLNDAARPERTFEPGRCCSATCPKADTQLIPNGKPPVQ